MMYCHPKCTNYARGAAACLHCREMSDYEYEKHANKYGRYRRGQL